MSYDDASSSNRPSGDKDSSGASGKPDSAEGVDVQHPGASSQLRRLRSSKGISPDDHARTVVDFATDERARTVVDFSPPQSTNPYELTTDELDAALGGQQGGGGGEALEAPGEDQQPFVWSHVAPTRPARDEKPAKKNVVRKPTVVGAPAILGPGSPQKASQPGGERPKATLRRTVNIRPGVIDDAPEEAKPTPEPERAANKMAGRASQGVSGRPPERTILEMDALPEKNPAPPPVESAEVAASTPPASASNHTPQNAAPASNGSTAEAAPSGSMMKSSAPLMVALGFVLLLVMGALFVLVALASGVFDSGAAETKVPLAPSEGVPTLTRQDVEEPGEAADDEAAGDEAADEVAGEPDDEPASAASDDPGAEAEGQLKDALQKEKQTP